MKPASSPSLSIRLDEKARRDVRLLKETGLSRSEAIWIGRRVPAGASRITKDQDDHYEKLEFAALMTSWRGES